MRFKEQHKDYKGYESDEFVMDEVPAGFSSALQGFITGHCKKDTSLKAVINHMAGIIPTAPTQNWGRDFLINDLSDNAFLLCKEPFHKTMDFLADLCVEFSIKKNLLNEFLEDQNIGYELELNGSGASYSWITREDVTSRTDAIEETSRQVKSICSQTLDHLEQAKEHLLHTKKDRDRKDAVRDCLSALETMLKKLSGEKDIKDATKKLRDSKSWGEDIILKDGLSLWDRMHDLYPDMRHGNPIKSAITDEAALYWLERITCFIRYMAKMQKINE
jgi:hypothetical protein